MSDSWEPARRTVERRNGETEAVREVVEVQCRACRGYGARQVDGANGQQRPELVRDVHERGCKGWLRRFGYDDGQVAPCDGCLGVGWVEMREVKR